MTVDREQIRRDASDVVDAWARTWAQRCLLLLAELEQAEKERDDLETELVRRIDSNYLDEKLSEAEARLAKVPALVEALTYCARQGAADNATARAALAEWERE